MADGKNMIGKQEKTLSVQSAFGFVDPFHGPTENRRGPLNRVKKILVFRSFLARVATQSPLKDITTRKTIDGPLLGR
jgi:hypothetical protein